MTRKGTAAVGAGECAWCAQRLDHCHGTLLVISAEELECSDADCTDLQPVRHDLVAWVGENGTGPW